MANILWGVEPQEFVSNRVALPTNSVADTSFLQDITWETAQLYYFSSGVKTIDAGEAAGTVVVCKLAYDGVLDEMWAYIGNDWATSLTWTTDTVLPIANIKPCKIYEIESTGNKTLEEIAVAQTADFAAGERCIDHVNGMIYGKKATTGVSDTAAYKIKTTATWGWGSIIASEDLKSLNWVTLVADNAAAPATDYPLPVGWEYNSSLPTYTTGDRTEVQMDANGQTIVTDLDNKALLTTIDADTSKIPSQGTAAMAGATPTTLATDDTQFWAVGAAADVDGNVHGQLRYIGEAVDGIEWAITTDDSAQSATPEMMNVGWEYRADDTTYTDGDAAILQQTINGFLKMAGYDPTLDINKNIEQAPVWSRYTEKEPIISTAYELTASFADVWIEVDVRGYNELVYWVTLDIGTSTKPQLKVLFKHTEWWAEEYREIYQSSPAGNITDLELNVYELSNADQLVKVKIDVAWVASVQLQAKDLANGDWQIDALYVTKIYS